VLEHEEIDYRLASKKLLELDSFGKLKEHF
jgi:hypothetical protein